MTVQFLDEAKIDEFFFYFQNPNRARAQYRSRYQEFAEELKANPGRWGLLPVAKTMTPQTARVRRGNIRTTKRKNLDATPAPFRTGVWEADVHENQDGTADVYVRFMGE